MSEIVGCVLPILRNYVIWNPASILWKKKQQKNYLDFKFCSSGGGGGAEQCCWHWSVSNWQFWGWKIQTCNLAIQLAYYPAIKVFNENSNWPVKIPLNICKYSIIIYSNHTLPSLGLMIPSLLLTLCSTLLWDSSSLSANCLSTTLIPESLITSKSSSCIRIIALINHFTLNLIHELVFPIFIITISSSDALRIWKIINQAIFPSVDGIWNSQH